VQPSGSAAAEALARALCGRGHDDALLGQARIVAENHLLRRAIRQRKLNLIERQMSKVRSETSTLSRSSTSCWSRFLPSSLSICHRSVGFGNTTHQKICSRGWKNILTVKTWLRLGNS
jgi:hypothetical protein